MKMLRLLLGIALAGFAFTASATDSLETGFLNPPDSAKPQTWWHWMNGNITKEGITLDLEAMKQIGLGGATIVNVDCGIPRGDVPFMSPAWREDFKFAVSEANRLGLQLCVENCAGWSSSGGPWNTVTNAMQRLTSSEVTISGPTNFNAPLPQPPVTLGFYRDIAVLAFAAPATEIETASNPGSPLGKLEIKHAVYSAENGGGSADVTAKIIALVKSGRKSIVASSDELGGDPALGSVKQLRIDFTLEGKPSTALVGEGDTFVFPARAGSGKASRSFGKTSADRTFVRPPPVADPGQSVIPRAGVLDLTAKMAANGQLQWEVPAGRWTILRLGYTPTGEPNHPAPEEGRGLECDKMSKAALDVHWDGFMQKVLDDIGPFVGKGLNCSLIDSYEVGGQDWTADFRAEFQKRRGYDPLPFLPTFTRRIVGDPAVTERFLWDMRRTIADLFADNYYAYFSELCRRHGLLSAVEPYTGPFESLQCGAPADIVMGEFWTGSQGHPSVKMAASIAHIYGKTFVGAESFTASGNAGRWMNDPYALKTLGDLMYCQGLNRYIFHRYAMQPWTNRWPGMTMGEYGLQFERTLTWWQQGKAWIDYISHCQYMLQQGRAVADAAYFTGESAPVEMRVGNPPLPAGYDYDAVDAGVLLHGATVQNGRITLASGANYAVLILPPDDSNFTPQMLACIHKLVRAGATVVGARPEHSPSLANFPNCDAQVKALADELWGKCDGSNVLENADGRGRIVWGKTLTNVFASQNLKPDFEFKGATVTPHLAYTHRIDGDADIYFISNQRRKFENAECTFRVSGKIPELWHPETGLIEPVPIWNAEDGRTRVRLNFEPAGSVFVVFRHAAGDSDHVISITGAVKSEPTAGPKLEIKHAVYSANDGAGEMDVTAKVAEAAHEGQYDIPANNDFFDRDPTPNHVKALHVDYLLNGQPGHATAQENEMLLLPVNVNTGALPPWQVSVAADGAPVVKAWDNGSIELKTAAGNVFHMSAMGLPTPTEIVGSWNLQFPPNWGAPPAVTLDKLISWTDHTNSGVRYFSGTAIYEKELEISAERLTKGRELWLDLGVVKNFAEVSLNGQPLGTLWKPPFIVNITAAAKSGANKLVVKVTNLWPNRLIGDEQLPPDRQWDGDQLKGWPQWLLEGKPSPTGRFTFETWRYFSKTSPLLESGLIGPVKLRTVEIISANQR
ncbi:MAG TPA: glycosyl hydrolase [Verrucomicrobiae bacterium]|jgi:hypothetical protein|nr:glycosyl hydrolase [Verrucomicrobiae bacterium]